MDIFDKLDKHLEDTLFYEDLPGLVIGVSIDEASKNPYAGLDYKKAVGYKNFATKEPLLPEHIFHMASVTKLFVGTAVLKLWEEGKLDLEAPVVDILPWLYIDDIRYKAIRIRHLLTHTAGLSDVLDYGWDRPEVDGEALRRYATSDEVSKSRLLWDPSENKFQYSNMGYEILGTVIAEVSNVSFEEYVTENIFKPLKMNDSELLTFQRAGGSLALSDLSKAGMAMPHKKDKENHIILEAQYPYNREHGPSSTLTSNVYDIEKWAKAHLSMGRQKENRLLKPETYEKIWAEQALVPNNGERIGLSWFIREQNDFVLYGHEGNDDGFRASFWICPELSAHVVVASNISRAPVKKIGKKVFDIITRP